MYKPSRRKRQKTRLLEQLEPRLLLSASFQNVIGWGTASSYGESITGMATDSSGNLYVTGYFVGTMDVDPSPAVFNLTSTGGYDIFLMKFTAGGNLAWADSFGEAGGLGAPGNDMGGDLLVDGSGTITITGQFAGTIDMDPGQGTANLTSVGGQDGLLAKFDSNGGLLWAKSFGGSQDDSAGHIVSDGGGGYLLTGGFQGTADLDPGPGNHPATAHTLWDGFLARLDGSGNLAWANTYTAADSFWLANVAVDKSGNIYAAGSLQDGWKGDSGIVGTDFDPGPATHALGGQGGMVGFLAKYTPSGKLSWAKEFGDGTDGTLVFDMTIDPQGNLIMVGSFGGSGDFDPGPGIKTLTEHQSPDAFTGFVMKVNAGGKFQWAGALLGTWWSDAYAVKTDSSGGIYVTGEINDLTNFDITGAGTDSMQSQGQDDAFLAKYDPAGRLAWVQTMGSTGYDHGLHVALGPGNSVYTAGYFTSSAHFGPQDAGADLVALGNQDSFVALFTQTPALTTLSLSSSKAGRATVLAATVSSDQGVPSGQVVFKEGNRILGTAQIDATGRAVLRATLHGGSRHLTIQYLGNEDFATSTLSPTITVG